MVKITKKMHKNSVITIGEIKGKILTLTTFSHTIK